MRISILLPLKENFAAEYAGAVSLFIKNTLKETKYKKNIQIFGNTNYKKIFFKKNYINISFAKNIFKSENNSYVSEFIKCQNEFPSDIIELHNRPLYVKDISKLNKNIFFYFHNDPLEMKGSKSINERLFLLNNTKKIIFISSWLKKRFFLGRFIFDNDEDIKRAKKMGIKDLNRKYDLNEIVSGDSIFSATGITDGDLVKGINIDKNYFTSETLVTHKSSNTFEIMRSNEKLI